MTKEICFDLGNEREPFKFFPQHAPQVLEKTEVLPKKWSETISFEGASFCISGNLYFLLTAQFHFGRP